QTVEDSASGWGIEKLARQYAAKKDGWTESILFALVAGDARRITARMVGQAASKGDRFAGDVLFCALDYLAEGMCSVITLLCPRRFIIGGGVSLMGEELFFQPLRRLVAHHPFRCFADCYDIVPAALGEEVVVHGALALARRRLG